MAETDQNNPPLGVQVEYYSWLFKIFDEMIQKHAAQAGRPQEIYLISHVLLSRMVSESKTQAERDKWFAYIDEKQGRKVPFIILEADEEKYVSFLGRDRVASLGGRGGSCTNAMRRIASINNNWCGGGMGGDLAYERQCQKHIYEAGGFGAMGYIFEWTNTEVFGYLAAQYLWRNAGVPGINNDNQTDFLDYAYRLHYGDEVGDAGGEDHGRELLRQRRHDARRGLRLAVPFDRCALAPRLPVPGRAGRSRRGSGGQGLPALHRTRAGTVSARLPAGRLPLERLRPAGQQDASMPSGCACSTCRHGGRRRCATRCWRIAWPSG